MKKTVSLLLCFVLCFSLLLIPAAASRDTSFEEALASDLKELGLFEGVSDSSFELERAPTRAEALVMLIRLLGEEEAAVSGDYSHPFTDVPEWADAYVGYAYQTGLTTGISDTEFGMLDASCATYLTFVLRALGYEEGEQFSWSSPYLLAKKAGLLPSSVKINGFTRADVVLVSYAALSAYQAGTEQTLAEKLVERGVFEQERFDAVYDISLLELSTDLSAGERIYYECAPATFLIYVYNSKGALTSTGSGFFIDENGTAVTNYHVIDGGYTATAEMMDGTVRDIMGICGYDKKGDWAVIKVAGSNYPYLEIGNGVTSGETVYALGSALGMSTSISSGLVSNEERVEGGVSYIQTSADISPGSSGGALVNADGEVVGITTASYVDGNGMYLALPISCIEGYSENSLVSLSSLRDDPGRSKIKEYSDFNGIPDFGAYMSVGDIFHGTIYNITTYYYSHEALRKAGTYDSAVSGYTALLREWGFYATGYFVSADEQFAMQFYGEYAPYGYQISIIPDDYFVDEDTGETTACLSLTVRVGVMDDILTYEEFPNVPDFGWVFGIEAVSQGELTGSSYYYEYDGDDIIAGGYGDWFFSIYASALSDWSFDLVQSYSTMTFDYYRFENADTGYSVELTRYEPYSTGYISVVINKS